MTTPTLREAAQAVLTRWDSPQWEWTKHGPTADLMHALRVALAQPVPDAEPAGADYRAMWRRAADECSDLLRANAELSAKILAAHPQPAPLTFSQITSEGDRLYQQDDKWHNANEWFERGVRFAERAHGIVPAPTTDQSHPQR